MHWIETEGSAISKSLYLCVVDWSCPTSEEDASTEALSLLPRPGCWSSVSVEKSLRALSTPLKCVCITNVVSVEHSRQVLLLSIYCCTQSTQSTTCWTTYNSLAARMFIPNVFHIWCVIFWHYTAELPTKKNGWASNHYCDNHDKCEIWRGIHGMTVYMLCTWLRNSIGMHPFHILD